jgi:hypothetical protein
MVSCFSSSSSCVEDYIAIIKTSHGYIKLGPQKPVVEPTTLGCVSSSQERFLLAFRSKNWLFRPRAHKAVTFSVQGNLESISVCVSQQVSESFQLHGKTKPKKTQICPSSPLNVDLRVRAPVLHGSAAAFHLALPFDLRATCMVLSYP